MCGIGVLTGDREGGADSTAEAAAAACTELSAVVPASPQASKKRSLAGDLPLEVLVIIISFGQVGRVCKSWSLAAIARTFTLLPEGSV